MSTSSLENPIIVTVFGASDSGHMLIHDIFKNNSDDVYIDFGPGKFNKERREEFLEKDHDKGIEYNFNKYGSSILCSDTYRDSISKDELKALYRSITDKKIILCRFNMDYFYRYYDLIIFTYRDMRSSWVVTRHKDVGLTFYVNSSLRYFRNFKRFRNGSECITVKLEHLIGNEEQEALKIFDFLGATRPDIFKRSTQQYNYYFSRIDLGNMFVFSDSTNIITNKDLKLISFLTREYNQTLGYEDKLDRSSLFPETICEDIDEFIKLNIG